MTLSSPARSDYWPWCVPRYRPSTAVACPSSQRDWRWRHSVATTAGRDEPVWRQRVPTRCSSVIRTGRPRPPPGSLSPPPTDWCAWSTPRRRRPKSAWDRSRSPESASSCPFWTLMCSAFRSAARYSRWPTAPGGSIPPNCRPPARKMNATALRSARRKDRTWWWYKSPGCSPGASSAICTSEIPLPSVRPTG